MTAPMDEPLLRLALALLTGMVTAWLLLLAVLLYNRPQATTVKEAMRLLPDCLVLLKRLATSREVPRAARLRLWLLIAYLACPIDIVPDFIPLIGYADDVVLVVLALRSVIRRAGLDTLRRHWPGTPEGLATILDVAGLR